MYILNAIVMGEMNAFPNQWNPAGMRKNIVSGYVLFIFVYIFHYLPPETLLNVGGNAHIPVVKTF